VSEDDLRKSVREEMRSHQERLEEIRTSKRFKEDYQNLISAMLKIGGDLMLAGACAADTAQRIQAVENSKIQAVGHVTDSPVDPVTGKVRPVIDRDGIRLANECLDSATRVFEVLMKHGEFLVQSAAKFQAQPNPKSMK
jgi:hypothetical protein